MSYTNADLVAVQEAIIKLGTGDRVVQVDFSDGHSTKYSEVTMNVLKSLRSDIQREISTATTQFFRTTTNKGL